MRAIVDYIRARRFDTHTIIGGTGDVGEVTGGGLVRS